MPTFLAGLGQQAATEATQGILGLALGSLNDKRQIKQQARLTEQQMKYDQMQTDWNMKKQIELFNATGYGAQLDQIKKAGLSPGLIYGGGGAGGQSTNVNTGNVHGAYAPVGGGESIQMQQLGLQMAMQKAQIDNINADTKNKEAQTPNINADTNKKLMEKAWEYEKEGMGMQYQYGQAAANAAQQRNMEMWNQTNYGAQRQHMEDAGLSVGLMYGGGGQGAVSQGGQATQPSGPTSNPVAMALQYQQIEQQNEAIKSQTMLTILGQNQILIRSSLARVSAFMFSVTCV